ncbi:MAG: hypothetical protein PHC60_05255 [Heliobacteriaceae bacterium]|nr:hypothetical protein [Heliobacteriaceae bacterium]MDD4587774.1 hypothetical protein [Heliobacteriaceae bacterium]
MTGSFKDQVYQILLAEQETTLDWLIVQIFGGSLIAEGQMQALQTAITALVAEGKVERTLLGLQLKKVPIAPGII